jgi:hypothetical protein
MTDFISNRMIKFCTYVKLLYTSRVANISSHIIIIIIIIIIQALEQRKKRESGSAQINLAAPCQ